MILFHLDSKNSQSKFMISPLFFNPRTDNFLVFAGEFKMENINQRVFRHFLQFLLQFLLISFFRSFPIYLKIKFPKIFPFKLPIEINIHSDSSLSNEVL